MPTKPKPKSAEQEKQPKPTVSWADDQQNRGYYYDDAHGYEKFDPEADDEDKDEEAD